MLAPSSPIAFPPTSSPANAKRPRADDAAQPAKPRVTGGFIDDDSDEDGPNDEQPSPKRRMLQRDSPQADAITDPEVNQPPVEESQPSAQVETTEKTLGDGITTPPDSQPNEDPQEEAERYARLFGVPHNKLRSDAVIDADANVEVCRLKTCAGRSYSIRERRPAESVSYDKMVAARSKTKEGRAVRSYYGIDIHELMDAAKQEIAQSQKKISATTPAATPPVDKAVPSVEDRAANLKKPKRSLLWTEKYRARSFMDLVGDDLTNRQVLRWLKKWDPVVFPHAAKNKPQVVRRHGNQNQTEEEKPHRKILMLTGPPGLGKTTLAHVCARQAGYEVLEINASDDRSRDVVKGRIRTSLGTESVKTVEHKKPEPGKQPKVARPVCVVVDEVDGVVTGSGGSGEGGFVKALIDLVQLDQANSGGAGSAPTRRKKKADDFRQMRPLILICNDVYHPSLRPLRHSGLAEVIHVGKPSIDAVVTRLKTVFEKEGIPCDKDAARRLCEAAWGMTSGDTKRRAESNAEGDLRGVMVVGEWVAGRLKAGFSNATPHLTRQWVDRNVLQDLSHGGGGARGIGRGGVKEIVTRVFQEGAGFPTPLTLAAHSKKTGHEEPQTLLSFGEQQKKYSMARLREMVETSGETDKIIAEIFSEYPNRDYNDDSFLTKPDAAYEWIHFHDTCSSRLFASQEWELAPYISQSVLACHHLFASPRKPAANSGYDKKWGETEENAAPPVPFSGPRADYEAYEAEKVNRATLQSIQAQLPPSLIRSFRSPEHVATDFLPYLVRLVSPDVKPVVVGGSDKGGSVASVRRESEKAMVRRAAETLADVGISLEKGKIEDLGAGPGARTQWVYRMEPDLDVLGTFETAGALVLASQAPTRYAVRQVLDQELQKTIAMRENAARQSRFRSGNPNGAHEDYIFEDKEVEKKTEVQLSSGPAVIRDFFGRVITPTPRPLGEVDSNRGGKKPRDGKADLVLSWVTYNEGLNNAVTKPVSLRELLSGL
ncbi:hypothetical protein GQ53DRAFT_709411 [Thozetella sp. PMI_491]|nr:hypothetical protein GQ53DRAFT_709411 [Thozetella sp. PMI_491]